MRCQYDHQTRYLTKQDAPRGGTPVVSFQVPSEVPSEAARVLFGLEADAAQRRVLDAGAKRLILCCSRQWGKSTTAAALAALRLMQKEEELVVCVSPTLRQTGELIRKVRGFLRKAGVRSNASDQQLELQNGSRMLALPGDEANVRGFSAPGLVLFDEAARVGDLIYKAIRPMLAHGGDLVLLSTPFGERGFFWKEWAKGGEIWTRVSVPATECERIPAAFLEEERRVQGEDWFRQEYLCEFVGLQNQVFRQEWLDRARADGLDLQALEFEMEGEV